MHSYTTSMQHLRSI